MILYTVTVQIASDIEQEWLEWMLKKHIPEVLATGLFLENKVCKLLDDPYPDGATYSMQYLLKDMETYRAYQAQFAPALQLDFRQKYEGKFVASRAVMEVVSFGNYEL